MFCSHTGLSVFFFFFAKLLIKFTKLLNFVSFTISKDIHYLSNRIICMLFSLFLNNIFWCFLTHVGLFRLFWDHRHLSLAYFFNWFFDVSWLTSVYIASFEVISIIIDISFTEPLLFRVRFRNQFNIISVSQSMTGTPLLLFNSLFPSSVSDFLYVVTLPSWIASNFVFGKMGSSLQNIFTPTIIASALVVTSSLLLYLKIF